MCAGKDGPGTSQRPAPSRCQPCCCCHTVRVLSRMICGRAATPSPCGGSSMRPRSWTPRHTARKASRPTRQCRVGCRRSSGDHQQHSASLFLAMSTGIRRQIDKLVLDTQVAHLVCTELQPPDETWHGPCTAKRQCCCIDHITTSPE